MAVERQEQLQSQRVSTLRFLVHPGFTTYGLKNPDVLLNRYVQKLGQLPKDEILVVFTYTSKYSMRRPDEQLKHERLNKALMLEKIKALAQQLGKRAVVLSSDIPPGTEGIEKVRKMLAARGYYFDAKTRTVACGELWDACVSSYASALNKGGGFESPTELDLESSDYREPEELSGRDAHVARQRREVFDRTIADRQLDWNKHIKSPFEKK